MLIKIIGAIAAVLVIALIATGAAMYFRFIPIPGPILAMLVGAKSPEYSARYYPPNTLAYGWLTLAPGQGQMQDLEIIWERFNEFLAFRDLVDLAQDEFEDETGIDFETDVMPWVGPELSIGLLDFRGDFEEPVIAAMVGVRDRDAAADFLSDWLDYMEDAENADFDDDSYRGFDIVVDENGHQAYALTDEWLIFATSESALEVMLERIVGDEGNSLSSSERFAEARSSLPNRRFASAYVDSRRTLDMWEHFADDALGFAGPGIFRDQAPDWIAASAAWVELGIVTEIAVPMGIDHPLEIGDLSDPARLLPDTTLGFMATTFDPDIDRWRDAIRSYDVEELLSPDDIDDLNDTIKNSPTMWIYSTCRRWTRTRDWTKYWTWR